MWHFRIWFSKNDGVGWMVGLDDLRSFQPMILCISENKKIHMVIAYKSLFYSIKTVVHAVIFPLLKMFHIISDEQLTAHLTFRGKIRFIDTAEWLLKF